MRVGCRVWVGCQKVEAIIDRQQERDNDGLADFDAVDTSQDVDTIRAENGDTAHVDVVQEAKVEELAQVRLQRDGDHDRRDTKIHKVDNKKGD